MAKKRKTRLTPELRAKFERDQRNLAERIAILDRQIAERRAAKERQA